MALYDASLLRLLQPLILLVLILLPYLLALRVLHLMHIVAGGSIIDVQRCLLRIAGRGHWLLNLWLLDQYHNRLLLLLRLLLLMLALMLLLRHLNLLLAMLLLMIHLLNDVAFIGCWLKHRVCFSLLRIKIARTDVVRCGRGCNTLDGCTLYGLKSANR